MGEGGSGNGGDGVARSARRFLHGFGSWFILPFFLLGRWIDLGARRFDDPRRESHGLALILTGIEGASFLEQQMALGIADAGFQGRITIVDWTSGRPWRFVQHMRDTERHQTAARHVAARIQEFHVARADAPIYLIGYSGGAAVAIQALGELPAGDGAIVDRVALLAAACSPRVDVLPLVDRTKQGIWHFRSRFDVIVLGLLTRLIGTTDGEHGQAAGCVGFPPHQSDSETADASTAFITNGNPTFREIKFYRQWLTQFHYGGHFGYANRVWACETLGRTLGIGRAGETPPWKPGSRSMGSR